MLHFHCKTTNLVLLTLTPVSGNMIGYRNQELLKPTHTTQIYPKCELLGFVFQWKCNINFGEWAHLEFCPSGVRMCVDGDVQLYTQVR